MKRITTTVRISKKVREYFKKEAEKTGRTMAEFIREALEYWIEQREMKKEKVVSRETA